MTIELVQVGHRYRDTTALEGVTAALAPGTTALLGVNGAGKSTLLSAAGGVLRPSAGHVVVDGSDLWSRSTRKGALRAVALMPQTTAFPPGMTAEEVVTYLAWLKGVPRRAGRPVPRVRRRIRRGVDAAGPGVSRKSS